jgi:FHS family Na+ dependent glucose MFS transporter 1
MTNGYDGNPADSLRERLVHTGAYYLAMLALGFIMGIIGPTLPGLARQTGASLKQISFLFPAHSLGYLMGSFTGGRFYDRVRGHPVIAVALFVMAVVMFLIPVTSLLWLLVAILFLIGMAEGSLDVGANTLLVWVHGKKVRPFMNGLHFFFGLGAFLSPMVVARVLESRGGITWAYWFLSFVVFPMSVVLLLLKSPKIHRADRVEETSVSGEGWMILLIAVFFFLHVGGELTYGGWVYSYAVARGLADETGAAYLTSAYWGALTVGRLVGIPVSMKLRPRYMLLFDLGGSIVAVALILLRPGSPPMLWAGSILLGFSLASIFATTINFGEANMHISGSVTSWFLVGGGMGGMFFPWLVGQLFESVGPVFLPVLLLGVFTLALLLILFSLAVLREQPRGEPEAQPAERRV